MGFIFKEQNSFKTQHNRTGQRANINKSWRAELLTMEFPWTTLKTVPVYMITCDRFEDNPGLWSSVMTGDSQWAVNCQMTLASSVSPLYFAAHKDLALTLRVFFSSMYFICVYCHFQCFEIQSFSPQSQNSEWPLLHSGGSRKSTDSQPTLQFA